MALGLGRPGGLGSSNGSNTTSLLSSNPTTKRVAKAKGAAPGRLICWLDGYLHAGLSLGAGTQVPPVSEPKQPNPERSCCAAQFLIERGERKI